MLDENSKNKDLINNNEIFLSHKDQDENEINQNLRENEYISKDPVELSRFFKDEGNRFFSKKEYDVALIYFTKAIEYDPINKIFYSNRSACHLARGNYQMALKDAVKCTELDPTYVKGYYRAALAHFEMNQLERSLNMISVYKEHGSEKDIQLLHSNILLRQKEQEEKKQKFSSFNNFMMFNKYLHESNIYFSKLEIQFYTDDHRGVVAKQDIIKDEVILKVPKEMLISIELAKTTTIGEQITTFMYIKLNSPKHCLLTSYLLHERALGKGSKWSYYLDILPKDYSSFPVFYSEEELIYLQGSPFKTQILEKKEDIKKDYEKICENIPEFKQYSFEQFCETRMAVSSRIFGVKIDFRKTDVLAPFADLLNHKRPRTTHWYYDEKYKSFIIQSLDNISKGSEVYDSYGKKCNSRFLLNYGFAIEDNDANEFPITLKLTEESPLFEEKKILFKKEQEFIKKFRICENIVDYQVVDFFSFLRFISFDGDMKILNKIIKDNQKLIFEEIIPTFYLISPITLEHEIDVLKKIEEMMKSNLAEYSNTYEEDVMLIRKSNENEIILTNNQKNCILMRMSEKKILIFYLNFTRYCLGLFELTEKEIKQKVEDDFKEEECPYEFYIYEVILKFLK